MSSPAVVSRPHVAVIGGGFCGLAAAYELGRRGVRATVLERDAEIGGLAGSFPVGGARLEKFYHHWFTNDVHVMELIAELDQSAEVCCALPGPARTTRTTSFKLRGARFRKIRGSVSSDPHGGRAEAPPSSEKPPAAPALPRRRQSERLLRESPCMPWKHAL